MIDSHPTKNLAIAQFIQEFVRQPNDDELVDIEQTVRENVYLEEYGNLPDAQQLQDFRIQKTAPLRVAARRKNRCRRRMMRSSQTRIVFSLYCTCSIQTLKDPFIPR